MINKLISKSQVRVLNCENCPNEDYARGYTRAISDVLDLETIPTLGVDTLEKIKAEIDEQYKWLMQTKHTLYDIDIAFSGIKSIIDKYMRGGKE